VSSRVQSEEKERIWLPPNSQALPNEKAWDQKGRAHSRPPPNIKVEDSSKAALDAGLTSDKISQLFASQGVRSTKSRPEGGRPQLEGRKGTI